MRLFSKKQTQKPSTASKSPQSRSKGLGDSKSLDQESSQEQEELSEEEESPHRRNSTRSSRSNSKSPTKKPSSPTSKNSTLPPKKSPTKTSNSDGSLRTRLGRASTSSNLRFSPTSPVRSFTQPRLDAQSSAKLDRGSPKKASLSDSSDTHPLNLPPEEREKRRSALLAAGRGYPTDRMSVEPNDEQQSNDDIVMGGMGSPATPSRQSDESESTPVPPPHKSTPDTPPEEVYDEEAAEAYKATGNKFFKAGDYKKAIAEYTRAIEAAPRNATYLSNRSAAYMGAHEYLEALEDAKKADELDSNNTKILLRLARIYTALGRSSEALAIYNQMQPPASSKDMAPAVAMENYVKQAENALQEGVSGSMVVHALDQAERGLGLAVLPPRKWKLLRGEAYLKMGNVNALGDAQNVAMSLLRNNSQDPEALVLRGRALYAQGENEKALQHFRQAIACDPDYREAVKYLRLVQKLDKMKEDGNIAFKAGKFSEAVQLYTEALDVDPTNKTINSKILQNRALASIKLKEYQSAIDDCSQALNLDPTYLKARKTKARAMGESGNWEEAVQEYKSIAEQNPSEPGIAKDVRHAELELKKSKRKDYYKILGIEKDAGEPEIKKAYRKLAIVHHPDKNPGDPLAEQKFKEIGEAYETLSDPEKKARYDSGEDLIDPSEMFGGGMGGFPGGVQIDPSVIFNMMGGMGGMGGGRGGPSFTFSTGGGSPFGDGGHPFGGAGGGGRSGFQGFSFQ